MGHAALDDGPVVRYSRAGFTMAKVLKVLKVLNF
jgi:hypothetical protein